MLCAITMNHSCSSGSTPVDSLYVDYGQFFERLGCRLHYVSNYTRDVQDLLDRFPIEGIILSGGNDLSAEYTGSEIKDIRNPSPQRDALEGRLLEAAIERRLPILGICRGMQFINIFFGGSLTQDIKTELPEAGNHVRETHTIIVEDPLAVNIMGNDKFKVNSYHHQCIERHQVASVLKVFAFSKQDQMVEGLFHAGMPIAGIQWHPERKGNSTDENEKLVDAFLTRRGYWKEKS